MHARRLLAGFAIASLVGVGLATTAVAVETSSSSSKPTEPKSAQAKALEKLAIPQPVLDPVTRRFAPANVKEVPSFRRHVVPLLGKLGCNGRACHGSFQGRGGFRLSLFGYDFKMDHQQLLAGDEPRVNTKNVDASLILQKPTMRIPHEGGLRYKLGSWEHHVLLRWIQGGAVGVKDADPNFVRLGSHRRSCAFRKRASMFRSKPSPNGPTVRAKTSLRSAAIRAMTNRSPRSMPRDRDLE